MSDQSEALKLRLRRFALDVMDVADKLPTDRSTNDVANQLIHAANGAAATYRAACRGRSKAEFVATIGSAAEESDESSHWLEVLSARSMTACAEARNNRRRDVHGRSAGS